MTKENQSTNAAPDRLAQATETYNCIIEELLPEFANYWQLGHLLDTLVDYWNVTGEVSGASETLQRFVDKFDSSKPWYPNDPGPDTPDMLPVENYLVPIWYDDYCWWGIAAQRVSSYPDSVFLPFRERFRDICAANWNPPFEKAPFVWKECDQSHFSPFEPMYQGGVWNWGYYKNRIRNVPYTPSSPAPRDEGFENPGQDLLHPFQNTVTNTLYWVMMERLNNQWREAPFTEQADNEFAFLCDWMSADGGLSEEDRLVKDVGSDAMLLRERVTIYKSGRRVASPTNGDWYWAGDQGLALGGLITRAERPGLAEAERIRLENQAKRLVNGVVAKMTESDEKGRRYILPWHPYTDESDHGAVNGDVDDYSTGIGVFLRYALYAYQNNDNLNAFLSGSDFKKLVRDNADHACALRCDCHHTNKGNNPQTDTRILFYANDLASFVMAHAMGV